jgi:hypothetical protein
MDDLQKQYLNRHSDSWINFQQSQKSKYRKLKIQFLFPDLVQIKKDEWFKQTIQKHQT